MFQNIKRGCIFMADLEPIVGSEQGGIRPVIVVQNNLGNKTSPTIIIAPITAKLKNNLPMHMIIGKEFGLERDSLILLEQIRTIDKSRLKSYLGVLSDEQKLHELNYCLMVALGIFDADVLKLDKFEKGK